MKPTWIDINGGGLLRADSVVLIYRADRHLTEMETPVILTARNHELRVSAQRLDELVERLEAYGVPLLRCRRRHVSGLPDHWSDVWLNLGRVLYALPTEQGRTEVFLDGTHECPLELDEPTPAEVLASLRYLSERAS